MYNNKKNNKPSVAVLLAAQSKLDEVTNLLEPCLVSLTAPERKLLCNIEAKSVEFIKLSHGMAIGNPELFPEYLDISSFGEGSALTSELWAIFSKIDSLRDKIIDTKIVIGNHAMENALAFYNTVKIASRRDIPGVRVVFEELKAKLPPRRRQERN